MINKYKELNKVLEEGEYIDKEYKKDNYIYILTKTRNQIDNPNDDRFNTVGGNGPIRINLETNKTERIHYMDFPSEILPDISIPSLDEIANNIKCIKYLNEDDVFNFIHNICEDDFSEVFYRFECEQDEMRLSFRKEKIHNHFLIFLNKNSLKYILNEEDNNLKLIIINRIPRPR